MEALFDTIGDIRADRPDHGCTGAMCSFCRYLDDVELRAQFPRPKNDEAWVRAANHYRIGLPAGTRFTADDLLAAIGYPVGSPNQIGALFRSWAEKELIWRVAEKPSERASNHGRRVYVWERI